MAVMVWVAVVNPIGLVVTVSARTVQADSVRLKRTRLSMNDNFLMLSPLTNPELAPFHLAVFFCFESVCRNLDGDAPVVVAKTHISRKVHQCTGFLWRFA
jgi:hypothetical protein